MICEITDKIRFQLSDGSEYDRLYEPGVPILACGSFQFADKLARFLWNHHKLHCSQHVMGGGSEMPYLLVLRGVNPHSRPAANKIVLARAVCQAIAQGLNWHFLFALE